ncbi:MAG: DUF6600 domain-containing protein [Ignavibacteriales bacterium]
MKKILISAAIVLFVSLSQVMAQNYHGRVSFNYFYGSLSHYGEWIEIDNDLYAWHPYNVGRGWQPYTVGRWVWTSDGWYWDSFEPFGWATYHYGRWFYDDYDGWIWIPDDQWGPAWVEWRYSDDYIGWAPLPPYAVFNINVGIHFTYDWHFPANCWNYISYRYFDGYDVHRYMAPERVKYRLYGNTRYRNEYGYRDGRVINRGVDREFVERRVGRPVTERNLVETTRIRDISGTRNRDNDRVEVFRPNRDELNKYDNTRNLEIKRSDRRSSLDASKVNMREMGREVNRENINRNDGSGNADRNARPNDRGRDVIRTDQGKTNSNDEIRNRQGNEERKAEPPSDRTNERRNDAVPDRSGRNSGNTGRDRRVESNDSQTRETPQRNVNPPSNNAPQVRENRSSERPRDMRREEKPAERSGNSGRDRRR